MDLVIRRARPSDKRQVREAVRTIWGGHDRVPRMFDRWVTHRTGPFFVAESRGRLVGMGKLTITAPDEAWLEGGRVAPRQRRRGIATALIAHRIAYARERGIRTLRFSTASDNTPIHRAARRFGFRRIAVLRELEAPAKPGEVPVRARGAVRVRALLGPLVKFGAGWEWRAITAQDVSRAVRRRNAFVAGGAAAIVRSGPETLSVIAFGGRGSAATELLQKLRAEAARRRLADVSVHFSSPRERRAARAAGYRSYWDDAAYLYEKRLSPIRTARSRARRAR